MEDNGCCSGPQYKSHYFHWVQRQQECNFKLKGQINRFESASNKWGFQAQTPDPVLPLESSPRVDSNFGWVKQGSPYHLQSLLLCAYTFKHSATLWVFSLGPNYILSDFVGMESVTSCNITKWTGLLGLSQRSQELSVFHSFGLIPGRRVPDSASWTGSSSMPWGTEGMVEPRGNLWAGHNQKLQECCWRRNWREGRVGTCSSPRGMCWGFCFCSQGSELPHNSFIPSVALKAKVATPSQLLANHLQLQCCSLGTAMFTLTRYWQQKQKGKPNLVLWRSFIPMSQSVTSCSLLITVLDPTAAGRARGIATRNLTPKVCEHNRLKIPWGKSLPGLPKR